MNSSLDSEPRKSSKMNGAADAIKRLREDGKFELCDNDEDRVKLTLNDAKGLFCDGFFCECGQKFDIESEMLRGAGNGLFNSPSPDLEEVLKYYSRSVIYAPPGSEELSLAYANRSAVLFKAKLYGECLEDINRALKNGYPDNLKPKLLIRRITCNYAVTGNVQFIIDGLNEARALVEGLPATNPMRKIVEDAWHNINGIISIERAVKTRPNYLPKMKRRSPRLPGASDAVGLKYSEEYGRHLVATRSIKSGEVLLIEKPYATIVDDEWIHSVCSHCARRTWNGIPCDHCVHAMFCSDECKYAAWSEYHDIECQVLGPIHESGLQHPPLMGLRMTVKAIKEAGSLENLRKHLKELDSVEESDVEITIDPNSYDTFYIMSDNPKSRTLEELFLWSAFASEFTWLLATRTQLFGRKLDVACNQQAIKNSEWFLFAAGLMAKNMRISKNRDYGWNVGDREDSEPAHVQTLIPIFSFANHRCYDATHLFRFDEDAVLVTPVPISKGDQIFTSYAFNYKDKPKDSRKEFLKHNFQFICDCLACKEDWSDSTCVTWPEQDLPSKVMKDLNYKISKFKYPSPEEYTDLTKLIPIKERYCKLLDFMYPRVKKPCSDIEIITQTIIDIYMRLSSTIYPPLVDELE